MYGARVTLIDVNSDALSRAVRDLRATGANIEGQVADVTDAATLRAAFDGVVARHGRLDVVFANAGISAGPGFLRGDGERNPDGEVENLSIELWQRVFAAVRGDYPEVEAYRDCGLVAGGALEPETPATWKKLLPYIRDGRIRCADRVSG